MNKTKIYKYLCGLCLLTLVAGCGSDSSTGSAGYPVDTGSPAAASFVNGVAVDPYIVGAVFQELAADGTTVLQRQSTATDESGVFTFPQPVSIGSVIELKISSKGLHGGVPFEGMLRRTIDEDTGATANVTPLTTLLANGSSEDDVLAILAGAGFTGLTADDLDSNPMRNLATNWSDLGDLASGISDEMLVLLQANMAVNAYLEISGNPEANANGLYSTDQAMILNSMAEALRERLNAAEYTRIITALAQDPDLAEQPTLGDLILTVLEQQQTLVALVQEDIEANGSFDPSLVTQAVDDGLTRIVAMVKEKCRTTTPPSSTGETLYADNCADCHGALADTTKPGRTATQIQDAIANNDGGMGALASLTTNEIQAIAEVLPAGTTPDPTTPPDGVVLYGTGCESCHGALADTTKPGRTAAQIQAAIDNNVGGMGFLVDLLSTAEVQAIADALPAATTPDPTTPPDGVSLYGTGCAGCHGALADTTKPGRTAAQIQAAIDGNVGGMGYLSTLTAAEVQAIADALPVATTPDPTLPPDGVALYGSECGGCHGPLATTSKPGRTATQIQTAITNNDGGMGALDTLTAEEIQAIADALPAATTPDPTTPPDGVSLYGSDCAGCHNALADTTKPGRTAAQIQDAIDGNVGGMGFLSTLTATEVQAIADALPAATIPDPTTPPDGAGLYAIDCAGCHNALADTTKPGRTAAQIQTAIDNNVGNMNFLSTLTAAEVQAIADVLPAATIPDPTTPPDGAALYSSNCAGCHDILASSTKPGRTASQIQTAIDGNVGGMGYLSTLTAGEVQAIADVLPVATDPGPDYSDCTACHGQPPSGNSFPDTAGAHAVHVSLASVNNDCGICHVGQAHDDQVEVGFPADYNAKSGTAAANSSVTCSSIICHGGQTTPVWQSGSLVVDTQCTSCHKSGTSEYNGYYSGEHSKHLGKGYSCTVCHNTTLLAAGHFSKLATTTFEQSPSATIGGGSTSVGSYSSGRCSSIDCHGSKSW